MRVFGYHYGPNGIAHYRIWQPTKYLKHWGVEADRLPDDNLKFQMPMTGFSNVPGIPSHEKVAQDYDLIFSSYVTSQAAVGRLYAQSQFCPVIIDIDDDIFAIDKSHTDYRRWHRGDAEDVVHQIPEGSEEEYRIKAKEMGAFVKQAEDGTWWYVHTGTDPKQNIVDVLSLAHGVTVSTPRLASLYKKYNPNICVVPNAVDPDIYPERTPINDGKIRLGLFGANAHYYDWEVLADQVKRVLKENKNVVLCVNTWKLTNEDTVKMGVMEDGSLLYTADFFKDIPEDQLEVVHFTEIKDWHSFLARSGIDIGLAPLVDTTFNRSKSNLKYLEWSALGIPGVYSKVEPYANAVSHGKTGYLAKPGEWYKYITRLVRNETERRLMGASAKRDVNEHHHQRDASRILAEFMKRTHEKASKAALV